MYDLLSASAPQVYRDYPRLADIASRIGRTSLREVPSLPNAARIFAKCEWENPFGTIKDRVAMSLLHHALEENSGKPLHLLEYTGGSLGISLSALCKAAGVQLTLVLPTSFDSKMAEVLKDQGTQIEWVAAEQGFWAVMERAQQLSYENPDYKFLNQHRNPANLWAHRNTTGPEILKTWKEKYDDTPIDAWVASIGTGGTLMGVYETLLPHFPQMKLFATSPLELPYGSEAPPNGLPKFAGSGGLGAGRKQVFVEPRENKIEDHFLYSYSECVKAVDEFHGLTGISIGTSAAANWLGAREVAKRLGPNKNIVTVLPSAGRANDQK